MNNKTPRRTELSRQSLSGLDLSRLPLRFQIRPGFLEGHIVSQSEEGGVWSVEAASVVLMVGKCWGEAAKLNGIVMIL